jgi:hypothetical protein
LTLHLDPSVAIGSQEIDQILPRTEHEPLYEKLELILRETVRRALLDDNFRMSFKDEASVACGWKL